MTNKPQNDHITFVLRRACHQHILPATMRPAACCMSCMAVPAVNVVRLQAIRTNLSLSLSRQRLSAHSRQA